MALLTRAQYLPLREIDVVNNAVNFSTADLHVIGSCEVYTTKAAGTDKKLYRYIENTLESRYESLVRLSASLSPPTLAMDKNDTKRRTRSQTVEVPEINLSRDSPFGSLSNMSARRTFAYLIATLNAAHPDYDFSHVLRPKDFKKERSLRALMNNVDSTLYNLRPKQNVSATYAALQNSHSSLVTANNDIWSPRMWNLIDQEMGLQDCDKFSYAPDDDPFDGEEGAIWSMHYFFFNKERKRVCYFHLRALSVISHSPVYSQTTKRKSSKVAISEGASKRASYWLGEQAYGTGDEQNDDDEEMVEAYAESSDDEEVDREHADMDRIRDKLSQGYWGYDGTDDWETRGPNSITEEIGDAMEI